MKTIHCTFTDAEKNKLVKARLKYYKGSSVQSWRHYILTLTKGVSVFHKK